MRLTVMEPFFILFNTAPKISISTEALVIEVGHESTVSFSVLKDVENNDVWLESY